MDLDLWYIQINDQEPVKSPGIGPSIAAVMTMAVTAFNASVWMRPNYSPHQTSWPKWEVARA